MAGINCTLHAKLREVGTPNFDQLREVGTPNFDQLREVGTLTSICPCRPTRSMLTPTSKQGGSRFRTPVSRASDRKIHVFPFTPATPVAISEETPALRAPGSELRTRRGCLEEARRDLRGLFGDDNGPEDQKPAVGSFVLSHSV